MKNIPFAIFVFSILSSLQVMGQCDTTAEFANKYLTNDFISDGQSYRALLFDDQIAEFQTTFYGGARYRIVSYSGMEKEQLIFSLYDQEDNLLFTNEDFKNSTYWDFEFKSTMTGRIEAKLDDLKQSSGCAVLLIGFER